MGESSPLPPRRPPALHSPAAESPWSIATTALPTKAAPLAPATLAPATVAAPLAPAAVPTVSAAPAPVAERVAPAIAAASVPAIATLAPAPAIAAAVTGKQLVANAEKRLAERWAFVHSKQSREAEAFSMMTMHDSQGTLLLLSPSFPCLWTLDKSPSTSQQHEGGKWTCGVPEIAQRPVTSPCIVYSVGSDFNDAFEQTVHNLSKGKCKIYTFDPTMAPKTPEEHRTYDRIKSTWNFHPWGLGVTDAELPLHLSSRAAATQKTFQVYTFSTLLSTLGHQYVDILKVDIESAEWAFLAAQDWTKMPVGQLLLEIHDPTPPKKRLPELLTILDKLHKAGYLIFASEPVCASCPGQYEVSFIHHSWSPLTHPPVKGYGIRAEKELQ